MKKLLFTLLLLQYVIVALGAKVVVHKTWIEYGVVSNNEEGIYLHTKFDVYGMKGKTIRVIFYFYNQRKQKIFSDVSGYRTDDNHLCNQGQEPHAGIIAYTMILRCSSHIESFL